MREHEVMVDLPVICDNCGRLFRAPNVIAGSGTVSMINVAVSPCPYCGGTGHVPDGVYQLVDDAIRAVWSSRPTVEDLRTLERLVGQAQEQGLTADETARRVEELGSRFQAFSDFIRTHAEELKILIGILAVVLAIVVSDLAEPKDTVTGSIESDLRPGFQVDPENARLFQKRSREEVVLSVVQLNDEHGALIPGGDDATLPPLDRLALIASTKQSAKRTHRYPLAVLTMCLPTPQAGQSRKKRSKTSDPTTSENPPGKTSTFPSGTSPS